MSAADRIRPTTRTDVPLLPAVELAAAESFRAAPGLAWIADSGEHKPETVHARHVEAGTSWVAEAGGRPVGFLAAQVAGDELHVWELAVEPAHQGRGLGRRLIEAAVAHARDRGLAAVTLSTFTDVPWNAPFYQRLGFLRITEPAGHPRLAAILASEVDQGLPGERRCAMRMALPSG